MKKRVLAVAAALIAFVAASAQESTTLQNPQTPPTEQPTPESGKTKEQPAPESGKPAEELNSNQKQCEPETLPSQSQTPAAE